MIVPFARLSAVAALAACAMSTPAVAQQEGSPLTPDQVEQIRALLAAQQEAEVSTPEEIARLRRAQLDAQQAENAPGYGADTTVNLATRRVNVSASASEPYNLQLMTLSEGAISAVAFFDDRGEPWPVQKVAYDRNTIAVNNDGCQQGGAQPMDSQGNVLTLSPCSFWTNTNMQVLLTGESRPIPFQMVSGSRDTVITADGLVTMMIDSDVEPPLGRTRIGQLDNSWVIPAARSMRIDPIDTTTDRSVNSIFVTPGITTDIAFMDSNQQPWPIAEIAYSPGVVAVNGPCQTEEAGIVQLKPEEGTSTMYMAPCQNARATVAVRLDGRAGAISLQAIPARRGQYQPDGTLSITVPGVSPQTAQATPQTVAVAGRPSAYNGGGFTHDAMLDDFLKGAPPQGARRASVSGATGVEGWIYNGALSLPTTPARAAPMAACMSGNMALP